MKKDYSIYDERYVELRSAGKQGWCDRESPNFAVHMRDLRQTLKAPWTPGQGRALDAGCGAGCWSFILADEGYDVTGIDLSKNAIQWARDKSAERSKDAPGSVEFYLHNATELQWLGKSIFHFALDGFLLHCLVGDDRHRYLRQVRHVLHPQGVFMVQSFCAEDVTAPEWEGWNIDPETRYQLDDNGVASKYIGSRESIHKDLTDAGLEIIHDHISPVCGGMLVAACRPR